MEVPFDSLKQYQNAVDRLEDSARLVSLAGTHAESGAVIACLYGLDDGVLVDIGAHKPYALILVAHCCVFLSGIEKNFWYVRGWAEQIFVQIETSLEVQTRFAPMLQWPRAHLGTL